MRPSDWEWYAEYVAERYSRHYGGDCPSEIRLYRVGSPLSAFGARPTDLRVPHTPLATAVNAG